MKKETKSAIGWLLGSAIGGVLLAGFLYFVLFYLFAPVTPPEMFHADKVNIYAIYAMIVGAIFGVLICIFNPPSNPTSVNRKNK